MVDTSAYSVTGYPTGGDTAETETLQRKIYNESTAKEAAKGELMALRRVAELHLRQLSVLAQDDSWESAKDKVARAVRVFDDDVKEKTKISAVDESFDTVPVASEGGRSYDFLKDTLAQNQRRCASLNADMMRVADANEELMSTMTAVKNTNLRLVDQMQSQNEEISRITQLRLRDEEKMFELVERHRSEMAHWKTVANQQLESVQSAADKKHDEMRLKLTDKLEKLQDLLRLTSQKASVFRRDQDNCRGEMKALAEQWTGNNLRTAGKKLSELLEAKQRQNSLQMTKLHDTTHSLRAQVDAIQETRTRENESWHQKIYILSKENEDIKAEAERNRSELEATIYKTEQSQQEECRTKDNERKLLHEKIGETTMHITSTKTALYDARRRTAILEQKLQAAETERTTLDNEMEQLRNQIRESDEALDRAVANNEQLRKQMETQRLECREQCDRDLQMTQDKFEERLNQLVANQKLEDSEAEERIKVLQQKLYQATEQLADKQYQQDVVADKRAGLQRDSAQWKAQMELAEKVRGDLEREWTEAHTEWQKVCGDLHVRCDEGLAKKQVAEGELHNLKMTLDELVRTTKVRDHQTEAYLEQLQAKNREVEALLTETKTALKDRTMALSQLRTEHQAQQAALHEKRSSLEAELQHCIEQFVIDKERLETEMHREKLQAQEFFNEYMSLRMNQEKSFHEAQQEPAMKINTLDQALQELGERHRSDLHHANLKRESYQKQIESLETELNRVQELLNEGEKKLQIETVAMKAARQANISMRSNLDQERSAVLAKLENAKASNQALEGKIQIETKNGEQKVSQISKELAALRKTLQTDVTSSEERVKAVQAEYASDLKSKEAFSKGELERERNRLDDLMRENERLRRFIGEHRNASQHVSEIGHNMQEQLAKMQSRTDMLRDELRRHH
eukprot:gnl/MRDRNA2_/MRDRNA2_136363_c0_seq1.p1 gnl/MRDRNA2_/MRDRNA2_136363_c0~~gnl/MRDRNA2_/MRDRNA2_136363_c0_seq1.p1  ORF type:complete len:919 (-),score=255.21 gnl/MRDRNA2_/MRDRNA2_136363_c0_seq1:47-2803(-)